MGSFKLGRIVGIEVNVHWSWIFIFAIVTWSFATGVFDHYYPQWSEAQKWGGGAFVALIFFTPTVPTLGVCTTTGGGG